MQDAQAISDQKLISLIIIAGLVLLVVLHSSSAMAVWLSLLLRPLMHGVSTVKTDFLLVFLVFSGLAAMFGRGARPDRTMRALQWSALTGGLAAGVLGMATFLSLAHRLHLPLDKYAYFFTDGYNSINHFAHLHVTKTGLYYLVTALGMGGIADHADTGKPFAAYLPPGVALAILGAAVVCLVSLLMAAGTVVRKWEGWRRALALVLYTLAGSHVVKCVLDGGPLTYDFLPSIVAVWLLFRQARGLDLWSSLRQYGRTILLIVVLFLAVIYLFSPDTALVIEPQQYAFFFGSYFLAMAALIYRRERRRILILAAAPALVWCALFYWSHAVPDIRALYHTITEREQVLVRDRSAALAGGTGSTVTDVTASVLGKRLYEVYWLEHDNPLRNRRVIVQHDDGPHYAGFIFALRVLRADSLLTFGAADGMTIRGLTTAGEGTDSMLVFRVDFDASRFPSLWQESTDIIDENNRFAVLYYLNDYFTARGLRDYVLIPMYYEETS